MPNIPNPFAASFPKISLGSSDVRCINNVYKFMGCSVLSINMTVGFNGTPGSLSITLVEDTVNGDSFQIPGIPSLHAFSLPRGGVNAPIFVDNGTNLNQLNINSTNVPFYFCGVCTNWSYGEKDINGRTISVNLIDPREFLRGVQCLLSGFALSQNIGAGTARYTGVKNVIDVFGFWNYGYDSNKNEYGMPWEKIKGALSSVGVSLYNITFEFSFEGTAFNNTPSWYRIDENIVDVISLVQKVANDGGSDLIVFTRKLNSAAALIEFRAIKRTNANPLLQSEINDFIAARSSIVESARVGRELKNQADSSIILGGMRNSNYVAWPSEYKEEMHLDDNGAEDYNVFPSDIKVRLFGGQAEGLKSGVDGSDPEEITTNFTLKSGAIYPFWGYTPDDHAYPLIEPFLPLDHLAFDADSTKYMNLKERIPLCKISVKNFSVRNVPHQQMFLTGDGDADNRPFAYLHEYKLQSADLAGYMRGLPLNTEVLRASLVGADCFFSIYGLYYPDIAELLEMPRPDWRAFNSHVAAIIQDYTDKESEEYINPDELSIINFLSVYPSNDQFHSDLASENELLDSGGKVVKTDERIGGLHNSAEFRIGFLTFLELIYSLVKQYALDNLGKKFIVCLPKSNIMQRIWAGLPVPTKIERPEIEYKIDEQGYWEYVPNEFDGISVNGPVPTGDPEDQIRRKFMADDGRFRAMAVMDKNPKGNASFNSNGISRAMFEDMDVSDFRPNRIATYNPEFVCIACQVNTLPRRPDLALVQVPGVQFDPTNSSRINDYENFDGDDEFLAKKSGILRYFYNFLHKDLNFREAINSIAAWNGYTFSETASSMIRSWCDTVFNFYGERWFKRTNNTEYVMDFKAIILPLTSNWVSYGPWYSTYSSVKGMVNVEIDESLVPWNFDRPNNSLSWDTNLNVAGQEKLVRGVSYVEYLDTANIVVAGFPEYGPGDSLGYNSNITSICVDFGLGGVKTTYNLATYDARPGTYRKTDYDDLSKARFDTRQDLPQPKNENLLYSVKLDGGGRFNN